MKTIEDLHTREIFSPYDYNIQDIRLHQTNKRNIRAIREIEKSWEEKSYTGIPYRQYHSGVPEGKILASFCLEFSIFLLKINNWIAMLLEGS